MKKIVQFIEQPLNHIDLKGLHLIEASAGTGKTWTLSSLMVRILVEKYMPRQVIATTFTRAAAAELKSRIRLRLQDMQRQSAKWSALTAADYHVTLQELKDPLAIMLFDKFSYGHDQGKDFIYLDNRLKLVLASLEELFVGTIDSFTQKLLREFSFDSGEIIPRQITEKEKQYPLQIVHDVLRAWLQAQPQQTIDLLLMSQSLATTEDYVATVSTTLNFGQAKLQEVLSPELDVTLLYQQLQDLIDWISAHSFDDLEAYYLVDGEYTKQISGTYFKKDSFNLIFTQAIPQVVQLMQEQGVSVWLSPLIVSRIEQIFGLFYSSSSGKLRENIFKKGAEHIAHDFYQHPMISRLSRLFEITFQLRQQTHQLDAYLRYYLSMEVRKRLPQVLFQAGETTFNQQIRTLSEALQDQKGQQLAAIIHQRYPIILVDEFQDTNQEQDNMLRSIWRDAARLAQGCFIAVGDPKQAIYGFRGGDILTYLNAFNDIASKQGQFYRLKHNFRSVHQLVEGVDALLSRQPDFGENIAYYQAYSGNDQLQPLLEQGQPDTAPLKVIQLNSEQNKKESEIIAQKIQKILSQAQVNQLSYSKAGKSYAICEDDIAVLARSQRELDQVQKQLEKRNILVNRTALSSVFSSREAHDIGAILLSIAQPDRETHLKRALLTSAIGLNIEDFKRFETDAEDLSRHMHQFRYARQLWLQKGFLIAWQWLAEHYHIWKNLAENNADQAERCVVNVRHLIELLSQHSYHYQGIEHLLKWYQLQLSSPAQRDWELERKLSSARGVQLMTIHKSKGLEFKIVFLMHANKALNLSKSKKGALGFFEVGHADQPERMIAVTPQLIRNDEAAFEKHQQKLLGEDRRLWYVALTRASYRMYYVMHHVTKKVSHVGGVEYWLSAQADAFEHETVQLVEADQIYQRYQPTQQESIELKAVDYPKQRFYPKSKTSFSYLAAHLNTRQALDALAEFSQQEIGAVDEIDQQVQWLDLSLESSIEINWIKKVFPKGAQAGTCLHDLLEHIDFAEDTLWEREIVRKLSAHGMWQSLKDAYIQDHAAQAPLEIKSVEQALKESMKAWLIDITNTPLHAVGDSALSLKDLGQQHRLAEFTFFLSLADRRFMSEDIHTLFQRYHLPMPTFEKASTARYLNGAIDLTYFDGQRFHIADYKSNYLGARLEHYADQSIENSMTTASYWLQASIYLVALHRYLSKHYQGYDIHQHLGGATYLYLRGMNGSAEHGVKHWQPERALILELDALLGQPVYEAHE